MDPRIHAALDGDLAPASLSAPERAETERLRALLDTAAGALRAAPAPDLTARVMAALPPAPRRAAWPARALAWAWRPRSLRLVVRPAYLMGCAAAAVALAAIDRGAVEPVARPLPAAFADAPPAPAPMLVQFRLDAPEAERVELAGTFTGWRPAVALHQTAPGEWTALVPLEPGVHDYAFVVDGERWVADPRAPRVADSFGGANSRLSLPPVAVQS